MLNTIFNIRSHLNINMLHFDCSMISFVVFANSFIQLKNIQVACYRSHLLPDLALQVPDKFLSHNRLPFNVFNTFQYIPLSCNHCFNDLLYKLLG